MRWEDSQVGERFGSWAPEDRDEFICDYIDWFLTTYRYAPSFREIAEYLGLASPSTVLSHLLAARERGRITWLDYQPRTITVVPQKVVGSHS